MRAAWLRTGTREAGVLSGRENQGPSLASTLPNRTNDSSPRVSTLCFRLLRAARRWLYLASLKQCKTSPGASVWTLQTGHDQDTMAAKSSKTLYCTRIDPNKLQLLCSDTEMDMPGGKDAKDAASILCRLLEQSTMKTFTGPQQPLHFLVPVPNPTPILNLHRKQRTSLFNVTFHSNRSVISQ